MSGKFFLRRHLVWLITALLMVAGIGGSALAQPAPQVQSASPDDDAFYALNKERSAAIAAQQSKLADEIFKGDRDPVKMCAYATEMAKLSDASFHAALYWLRQRQAEGKAVDRYEQTYLLWSGSADSSLMHQYNYCAKASFPDDDTAETLQYTENLLSAYETAGAEKAKAQASNDRLYYLSRLQAMNSLLDEGLAYIDILREAGSDEPRIAALVTRYPALKSEYETVH